MAKKEKDYSAETIEECLTKAMNRHNKGEANKQQTTNNQVDGNGEREWSDKVGTNGVGAMCS
jgi:hypothetical protein